MIQGVAAKWSFSSLSANKVVNQQVMRFAPFSTPEKIESNKTSTQDNYLGWRFYLRVSDFFAQPT